MTRRGRLCRAIGGIQDVVELRQLRMHVLSGMRILMWVGVLNRAPQRLGLQYHPRALSFFKVVSHLHARAGYPAGLWTKLDFRMSLVPVDRHAPNIHVHGAHVQIADGIQVLQDARADGRAVARLLPARARAEKRGG